MCKNFSVHGRDVSAMTRHLTIASMYLISGSIYRTDGGCRACHCRSVGSAFSTGSPATDATAAVGIDEFVIHRRRIFLSFFLFYSTESQ